MVHAMPTLGVLLTLVTIDWANAIGGCGTDSDCGPYQTCESNECVECEDNHGCARHHICHDRACMVPLVRIGERFSDLIACEGDCDTDSDCAEDLICFQRDGDEDTRFCNGAPSGYDLCIPAPALATTCTENSFCASLRLCEGTCDSDGDCEENLKCLHRMRGDPVPGCSGIPFADAAYCVQAVNKPTPAPTPNPTPAPTPACHDFGMRTECVGPSCVWWQGTCQVIDSWCVNGILDGKDCCAASCGTCGGENCAAQDGGASSCCPHRFKRACTSGEDTGCSIEGPHDQALCEDDDRWRSVLQPDANLPSMAVSVKTCADVRFSPFMCAFAALDTNDDDVDPKFLAEVRRHCPKSCGLCQAECADTAVSNLQEVLRVETTTTQAPENHLRVPPELTEGTIHTCEDLAAYGSHLCQPTWGYAGDIRYQAAMDTLRRLCPKTCGMCQAFHEKKMNFRGQCNAIHGKEQDFLGKCSAYVSKFHTLCSRVECGANGGPISVTLQGKLDDVAAAGIHIEMNNLLLRGFPKLALLEHASGDPIINVNGYKAKVDFPYGESTLMWRDPVVEFYAKADVATPDKKNQWFSEFELFAHGRQVVTAAINPTKSSEMSIVVFDDNGEKLLLDDAGTHELAAKSITVVVTKVADGGLSLSIRSANFDVSIIAEEAKKFLPNKDKARRYTHLDISLQKMNDAVAKAGILAELYGFVPMSSNTARMMTSISTE